MKKLLLGAALLALLSSACKKDDNKPVPVSPTEPTSFFAKGADVSWITEMESTGKKLYNSAGAETECMALMKALGMNSIRLRVWVNPSPAWNNTADVLAKALRAKAAGLKIMIDFHYSDSWADPGKQTKPTAWASLSVTELLEAIKQHTTSVLTQLKSNGITPEWVQVGNETNDGMLWPEGKASVNMGNYAQMINAGYDAVKAVFATAKVIVHVSNGWDNDLFKWNIGGLVSNGARFDVIGMSVYPAAGNWPAINNQCLVNMNDMVSRYNKEVMVVEVGMPWDNASASKAFITDIITKVKLVNASKGIGVFYWEPQSYGGWKGYTLGAFDNSGRPTIAMDAFAN